MDFRCQRLILVFACAALFSFACHTSGYVEKCPWGRHRVNCLADPCRHAKCPRFPQARCKADYCGGCRARFYTGAKEVTDHCGSRHHRSTLEQETNCPPEAPRVFAVTGSADKITTKQLCLRLQKTRPGSCCLTEPCEHATCPNHPTAVCANNYCGGCYTGFFTGSTNVTGSCGSSSARPSV